MQKQLPRLLLLAVLTILLVSCAHDEAPPQQTQAFGEPASTIPWNTPQRWEGQAGGFNAIRGGDEGY